MSTALHHHLKSYGIALDHCSDKIKFRAVKAQRRFLKGTNIITSQPLAALPLSHTRHTLCNQCFVHVEKLQRCSKCRKFFVCGKECFRQAWLRWHQWICEESTEDDDDDDDDDDNNNNNNNNINNINININSNNNINNIIININNNNNNSNNNNNNAVNNDQMSLEDNNKSADVNLDEEMLKRVVVAVLLAPDSSYPTTGLSRPPSETSNFNSQPLPETPLITKEAFATLMSHAQLQTSDTLDYFKDIVNSAKSSQKFATLSSRLSMIDLITYLCRFRCNNFSIHDNQLFVIGEGTYPIGSLFNHSCRSNAIVAYDGPVQVIRAIEDIEVGNEITISYLDVINLRADRKRSLLDKYFFECKCERCQNNPSYGLIEFPGFKRRGLDSIDELLLGQPLESTVEDVLAHRATENATTQYILKNLKEFDISQHSTLQFDKSQSLTLISFTAYIHQTVLSTCYRNAPANISFVVATTLVDLICRFPSVPAGSPNPTTLQTLSAATKLQTHFLNAHEWDKAACCGLYVLAMYLLVYPRYHPMIGLQAFTIGKCFWNATNLGTEGWRWAECYLRTAMDAISVGCGEKGLYRQVVELHAIVKEELRARGVSLLAQKSQGG